MNRVLRSATGNLAKLALAATFVAGTAIAGSAVPGANATPATTENSRQETVRLTLSKLDVGPVPEVPYATYDGRLFDGDVELQLPAKHTQLLGKIGEKYVYVKLTAQGSVKAVKTATAALETTTVGKIPGANTVLASADGSRVLMVKYKDNTSARLVVFNTLTGDTVLDRRVKAPVPIVLALDTRRLIYSVWVGPGTNKSGANYSMSLRTGKSTKIGDGFGYRADIAANRLASYEGDPYRGGCSVVTPLSVPEDVLTRSCSERVEAFAADAGMTANVGILTDGLGAGSVVTRTDIGSKVATYHAPYYIGNLVWEDADTLLIHVYSRTKSALVRCTGADCEIALPDLDPPMARPLSINSSPLSLLSSVPPRT